MPAYEVGEGAYGTFCLMNDYNYEVVRPPAIYPCYHVTEGVVATERIFRCP